MNNEHVWVQEQIAAFLANGLDAAEAERFRGHVRDCVECASAVEAAQAFDAGLANLFAAVRPGPMLEDRTVRALRTPKVVLPSPRHGVWKRRLAIGLAASVIAGALGTGVSLIAANGGLPMPGGGFAFRDFNEDKVRLRDDSTSIDTAMGRFRDRSSGRTKTAGYEEDEKLLDLTNTDKGLESELQNNLPLDRLGDGPADTKPRPADGQKNSHFGTALPSLNTNGAAPSGPTFGFYVGPFGEAPAPVTLQATEASPDSKRKLGLFNDQSNGKDTNGKEQNGRRFEPDVFYHNGDSALPSGVVHGPSRGDTWGKLNEPGKQETMGQSYANPQFARTGTVGNGSAWDAALSGPVQQPKTSAPPQATKVSTQAGDPAVAEVQAARKIIIRSGDIEFEVESFDSSVASVTLLVTKIKGGYVGTVNSEKLPNGKVKGSIVVRVPPEALDGLLLDLRKELGRGGELKGQKIGSSDITKQYTDLESRLKAARAMEQRLLAIIKDGKGEIKQLLEAEKELGVWRTKIEEYEGELRYYANQAALSTLTITLAEKDIRTATGLVESERVQAGVEVEDVDKAFRDALAAVSEFKGRVTKSELKQLSAGQFTAVLFFEVAPDSSGPVRDRLRQLGRVARLEIDRVVTAEGGPPVKDAKVKRGDATFQVQFYNLANVAPRETAVMQIAATDVPATFRTLRDAVEKAKGRVVTAQVSEGEKQNVSAQFDFEVKRTEEATLLTALAATGDIVSKAVTRAPESDNVTDTKVLFRTTLFSAARLRPRETATLAVEVSDVEATSAVLTAQVNDVKGRVIDSQVTHDRTGQMKAKLVYDVPLAAATGVVEKTKAAGVVRIQQTTRDPSATEGKFATARLDITLSNTELIVPTNDGVWPQVRKGLTVSASVLLSSLTWVVFGLCVVLPWMVVAWFGYRLVRRMTRPAPLPPSPPVG